MTTMTSLASLSSSSSKQNPLFSLRADSAAEMRKNPHHHHEKKNPKNSPKIGRARQTLFLFVVVALFSIKKTTRCRF
jgi:hypothetical protein